MVERLWYGTNMCCNKGRQAAIIEQLLLNATYLNSAYFVCETVCKLVGVAGGLLVKALDCGSKDPGFHSY